MRLFMQKRFVWLAATLCVVLTLADAVAQGQPEETDRSEIERSLDASLAAGYREKNIEKFLASYAPDARIVNYIWGELDRRTLGTRTLQDFESLSVHSARVEVLEARIDGPAALIKISFGVTGILGGRQPVNRQDRYFLRMRREPDAWVIVEQSYREDFQENRAPHGIGR